MKCEEVGFIRSFHGRYRPCPTGVFPSLDARKSNVNVNGPESSF